MENGTLVLGPAFVGDHGARMRVTAMIAALLLVLGMIALVQHVETSPAGASVVAAAAVGGVGNAQINVGDLIRQIVCPILIAVRNALANAPFIGPFATPILNSLIRAFGCAPS